LLAVNFGTIAQSAPRGFVHAAACAGLLVAAVPALAAGSRAGTLIENTASVDFELAGTPGTIVSNTVSFRVAERLDVVLTLQSPQVVVVPNDPGRALLFTVSNTGNGVETFILGMNSLVAGDDFDPVPAAPDSIFFDTDGSGDFNAGDVAYTQGVNDPTLDADQSIDVLVVNDIPGNVTNAQLGRSELTATAVTGSGTVGTVIAGEGDGGVDAVVGTTGAGATAFGEYLVDDVAVRIVKAQSVLDPSGGAEPVTGAVITYTITVEVVGAGVATAATILDPIPSWTRYVPGSLTLNGNSLSDAADGDAGEIDSAVQPSVVARLGDLTEGDGLQTVVFQVQID